MTTSEIVESPSFRASAGPACSPSDREKAAFIFGMARAFLAGGWPPYFNEDAKSQWLQRAGWAKQMINGGVFNPTHAWAVLELYDDEVNGEI